MDLDSLAGAGFKKLRPWVIAWTVVVFICGILCIALPIDFAAGVTIVIGCLVVVAAIGHLLFAFQTHGIGGFLWQIVLAGLYGIAALCLLVNPLLGLFTLAFCLAGFLLAEGVVEVAFFFRMRNFRHSYWLLLDGIATIILGLALMWRWGAASLDIIGTFIGASMILSAVSRIIFLLAIRPLDPAGVSPSG
jgi:uncharacterized membrane protein HdeD (DUF308 family)